VNQPEQVESLRGQVERFFRDEWKSVEFDSAAAYEALESWLGNVVSIRATDTAVRNTARDVLRNLRSPDGERQFENAVLMGADGQSRHVWVQMEIADFDQAASIVDRQEQMALAMIRKANKLARRAQHRGYAIQVPFPWLDESETPSGD